MADGVSGTSDSRLWSLAMTIFAGAPGPASEPSGAHLAVESEDALLYRSGRDAIDPRELFSPENLRPGIHALAQEGPMATFSSGQQG